MDTRLFGEQLNGSFFSLGRTAEQGVPWDQIRVCCMVYLYLFIYIETYTYVDIYVYISTCIYIHGESERQGERSSKLGSSDLH